ncbi:ABC transporter permease [Fulvivirgaceae bacterium PWU4]|uniref:ABC transporter permease n=1 Tax=Chryseosolibacter histidini TaxID=2782349 RepID=A0AAP2GQN9_9BACT|nr:ABC transporter permease [Chryseosolibacter histidini]MBT1698737.1 ABC transporter permease [Chryseosolibacter histidini]
MLQNNFRITRRSLFRNRSHALINLFGLTLGLTVSMLIFLFVRDELSYDKYLSGYEQIFRIQPTILDDGADQTWATSEGFLVPALSTRYPEIEAGTRILRHDGEISFKTDSEHFAEYGAIIADSTFFKVFPFPFVYGDRNTALNHPGGMVISRDLAIKYFGNTDPVGKLLTNGDATRTITGVFENVPANSHLHFKIVFPMRSWWPDADESRNMYAFYSYVRLRSAEQAAPFSEKLRADWYRIYGYVDDHGNPAPPKDIKRSFSAMPVSDIYLTSHAEKEFGTNSSMQLIYIFIAVAILVLVIAVINYVNLSNALALKRAREVAIRKTIGATRKKLFLGFILEAYAFSFIAFVISVVLVALVLPYFNTFTGKQFSPGLLLDLRFIAPVLAVWAVLGFLSGLYPAMILSSFNPIQTLKSGISAGKSGPLAVYLRRTLLVSQFAIAALMIVSAFTIRDQLNFIERMNIGFNKHNIVVVPVKGDLYNKREAFKNEVNRLPGVESSTFSSAVPGKRVVFLTVRVPDLAGSRGGDDKGMRDMRVMAVDHDFIKTLKLELIAGRDFSVENASDAQSAFILNEAAVREFDLKDPIGRPFEYQFGEPKTGHIIGVVRDFNFASVHSPVEPLMMHILPWHDALSIRLKPGRVQETLAGIEAAWKQVSSSPFDYNFLDSSYDAMYKAEKTTGRLITLFTVLALVIACLGLFGVVSFFIAQRTREVSIRKTLGASHVSLMKELSKEYVVIVIVANLVALYPAWLLIDQWLQKFQYRVELSLLPFIIAFVASSVLAYCSIIYVVLKTAGTNPAVVLRNE